MKGWDILTKRIRGISSALIMMFIFTTISPNFTKTVKADTVSSEVEQMLSEIVQEHGIENVVFENGIIINVNEEVNLKEISQYENVIWSVKDYSVANLNENVSLRGLKEGTTFLVGQVGGKYHLRELYVAQPKQEEQKAVSSETVNTQLATDNGSKKIINKRLAFAPPVAKSKYVVYLDPGHGGLDSGATGNGVIEKQIVLNIALDTKRQLENAGVEVIMSRTSDVYVSLKERSDAANAANPDIFVSIHINSAEDSRAYGIETFYMKDIDFKLAGSMQNRLMQYIPTKDRGVKYADFHVMRETTMPSTLVECGFLSNPAEADRLKQPSTQSNLAEAITNGAVDYLRSNVSLTPINGERIYGNDRYETSYKLFEKGWQTAENVVLASGIDYPDALTAAPLASKNNAPILLTEKTSLSNQPKLKEILVNKGVKNVFIVGGNTAIPSVIDGELAAMGITVKRLGGNDRYETSVLIANEVGVHNGEVSLVNGLSFADGLSMSPIAAKNRSPILLTRNNEVPASTRGFLNNNNITKTFIIGATTVINDAVSASVSNPERLGGSDRYDTNKKILDRFKSELDLSTIYIASAFTFPDALSSSALAGKDNNFVLLSNTVVADNTVKSEISQNKQLIKKAYILGGNVVISDEIIRNLGISNIN